jgi:hypothetical protein
MLKPRKNENSLRKPGKLFRQAPRPYNREEEVPVRIIVSLLILSAFLLIMGCQAPAAERPIESPSTLTPVPVSPTQAASTPADAVLQRLIEKAKADLVQQFAISADQIRVVEAREVTWPDASLGCPQPASAYAEVLTPGYWVLLEADGRQYPYHADQAEQLILCLSDTAGSGTPISPFPPIPVNPTELKDGEPWVPVN